MRKNLTPTAIFGRVFLVFILAVGMGAALATFTVSRAGPPANMKLPGKERPAVPVNVATVTKGSIPIIKQALGTVTPLANVNVRSQISGRLDKIHFEEGQMVQAGELLAEIDPRPYEFALTQAQGIWLRDRALLQDAETNLERYKKLASQDSISRQQLDSQAALVQQYQGAVLTDQAEMDTAKLNIEYTRITAPVTGRIGLRNVDAGNYVQVGDTAGLTSITQMQPISALFTVPEDDIPALMKQVNNGRSLTVTAFDRMRTTKLAAGALKAVGNQIDSTTGTLRLRAQFDNTDNALFPNQFVNIDLLIDTLQDQLIIPADAIQRGTPGLFVYLVKNGNSVTVRPVKLGPTDGTITAVLEGLQEGDQIVTEGIDKLREGASVSVRKGDAKSDATTSPPANASRE